MQQVQRYLQLMRPANIITAVSDILAGVAISGYFAGKILEENGVMPVLLLVFSTIGLYGGGVVFNDVFDAELDKIERPERPIPGGFVTISNAVILGSSLLILGVLCAFLVHPLERWYFSGLIAVIIVVAALVYDKWGKHHPFLGPLNMGLCRGLNLLLGMSIIPEALSQHWILAFIPILYIAAITMISRGEVHGSNKNILYSAAILYMIVIASIIYVSITANNFLYILLFIFLLAITIFPPLYRAIREPVGKRIGKAVKSGVLALIIMNAAWAAAFGNIYVALFILLLLPLSIFLAKAFAVT